MILSTVLSCSIAYTLHWKSHVLVWRHGKVICLPCARTKSGLRPHQLTTDSPAFVKQVLATHVASALRGDKQSPACCLSWYRATATLSKSGAQSPHTNRHQRVVSTVRYLSEQSDSSYSSVDILIRYWSTRRKTWPQLAAMALNLYAVPAMVMSRSAF
jgi:hypothetical protein